jgi:hypothetical protein
MFKHWSVLLKMKSVKRGALLGLAGLRISVVGGVILGRVLQEVLRGISGPIRRALLWHCLR